MPTHRVLSSVAHNLAHSFMSGMNMAAPPHHSVDGVLLDSCFRAKTWTVRLDFLTASVQPSSLSTPAVERSLRIYQGILTEQLARHGFPGALPLEAAVTVQYDLAFLLPCSALSDYLRAPFVATGTITDTVGRVHTGSVCGASAFPLPRQRLPLVRVLWRRLTRRAT